MKLWPMDSDEPVTIQSVIAQLEQHRKSHIDWAAWFESHPDDPAASHTGDAIFHRNVEKHYTKMINFLKANKEKLV